MQIEAVCRDTLGNEETANKVLFRSSRITIAVEIHSSPRVHKMT